MAIIFEQKTNTFYLESKDISYIFAINKSGFLNHLYFGKQIDREDITYLNCEVVRGHSANLPYMTRAQSMSFYKNECPTYGRSDFRQSMLSFNFDGVRVGDLKYQSHRILSEKPAIDGMPSLKGDSTLEVSLLDELHNIKVKLYYSVYDNYSVITRHCVIENLSDKPIIIDRALSCCIDFPDDKWSAITLPGAHTRERFMNKTPLSFGTFSIDSNYGVSSGQMNPFMALVRENTSETVGEAYGFNLIYSGDFTFKAFIGEAQELRLIGGINDFDFSWELKPGESFYTPETVCTYSGNGLGEMSRTFHDIYRDKLIDEKFVKAHRPIVINTWEATRFDFDTEKLCELIDSTENTGIDTFVLDDGWFGNRNGSSSGLGDWFVNTEKIDLAKVINYTHKKGLKFGLWFEPEMVNPDSKLYKEHPDYAIQVENLQPCLGRNQLVLDLTRNDVCECIINSVSKILNEYDIDYVKWDMNRSLTENYSAWLLTNGKETHHRYVLGLYKICDALIKGFPSIFFEGCASGGCRFDPAMLYYFPQIWTSDNTDAYMRSIIQYGTSLCYPLSTQSCHVSVCPNHQTGRNTPFNTRANISHLGATGYELDLTKLSNEEKAQILSQINNYKEIQDIILNGDLYRLNNPLEENLFSEIVVAKDKNSAVLTVLKPLSVSNDKAIYVYPQGLNENKIYSVKELNLELSGKTLMNAGLLINFESEDFASNVFHFIAKQ